MPDEKAWGNRKNQFYGADVSDIDSEDVGWFSDYHYIIII